MTLESELIQACKTGTPQDIAEAVRAVREEAGPFYSSAARKSVLRNTLFVLEHVFEKEVLPAGDPAAITAYLEASGAASGEEGMLFQSAFSTASRAGNRRVLELLLPHLQPVSWDFHNPLQEAILRQDVSLALWLLDHVPDHPYGQEAQEKAWGVISLLDEPSPELMVRLHAGLVQQNRHTNADVIGRPLRNALRGGSPQHSSHAARTLLPLIPDLQAQADLLVQRQDWRVFDQLALIAPPEFAQGWLAEHGDHLPLLAQRTRAEQRQELLAVRPPKGRASRRRA